MSETCQTCKWWDSHGSDVGTCELTVFNGIREMLGMASAPSKARTRVDTPDGDGWLETDSDFGCMQHERQEDVVG